MIAISNPNPDNIILADPSYNIPQKIDILIGAKHFFDIIDARQFKVSASGPIYQEIKFGFIVSGAISNDKNVTKSASCITSTNKGSQTTIENLMQNF